MVRRALPGRSGPRRAAYKDGPLGLFPRRGAGASVLALGDAHRGAPINSAINRDVAITRGPLPTTPRRSGPRRFRELREARKRLRQHAATMTAMVKKVLLASPRGYCAGVERAVETVEKALELYGPPVYVRKQIVHNLHVVRDLEARGAVFVDEETEVPGGQDGRLLGARRRSLGPRERRGAAAEHDRRDLPARDEGARPGAPLRGRRLHRGADRARGPRGGRRDDGRGARRDGARRVGRRCRRTRRSRPSRSSRT